ncbi:MAG TPA: NAD(P)-dependent oxidoreductase [Gemmatimonadales bacterium]|nr:NAD(P)-dependent oxidoreductase [Gemmatimonadales bacterium]
MPATRETLLEPDALFAALEPPFDETVAVSEAARCLDCGGPAAPAPCLVACPAGVDVPGFVAAIAQGDSRAAAAIIFSANVLGGSCARVCPADELCEGACVLATGARRPLEIARLQRFATDRAFSRGLPLRRPPPRNGKRIAVIGAGPAGLACAAELATLGYAVTVYDARSELGGLLRYAIAPYRQLREPLPQEVERIAALGVHFELHYPIDSPERLRAIARDADAVFLGIGLGADVGVRYPGDELPGVWNSLPFIEALKVGEPPAVGPRVAVIGGGNTAIDVAREAVRLGAVDVTILYRRTEAEMPAYPHEVKEARAEGVRFRWLTTPVRFLATSGRLDRVECQRMRLGSPDASGRRRAEAVPASEFIVPADTVIKAVGQERRTAFLGWIDGLELKDGLIVIDPATGQTTHPKYFAGGDAVNGGATVVEAVRAAKVAAHGIHGVLAAAERAA